MNVISRRGLLELSKAAKLESDAKAELESWYRIAEHAAWNNLMDVCQHFPSADQLGNVLIFDIRHNRYRLIVFAVFPKEKLYIKAIMTHKQYDRKGWIKWA